MATRAHTGTLTSGTPVSVSVENLSCPITVTLNSSVAGRKTEGTTNDGLEWFQLVPVQQSPTMLVFTLTSPATDVRFTGQAGDTWAILGNLQ